MLKAPRYGKFALFGSVSLSRGVRLHPDNELPANEKEKQRKSFKEVSHQTFRYKNSTLYDVTKSSLISERTPPGQVLVQPS